MVLLFLTLGSYLSLQSSNTTNIKFDVSGDNYENTRIEFTVPGFYLDTVLINGKEYSKVSMPGVVNYLKKGYPQVPRIAKSVIIPDNKTMKVRIIEKDIKRLKAPFIIPSKGNILRSVSPASVPYTFSGFYSSGDVFPGELVSLSEPFIIRDFRGITVYVNPVRYDAKNEELIILKKLVVEIYSEGIALSNIKKSLEKRPNSVGFANLYKDFFVNYSQKKLRYDTLNEAADRMIIISADQYVSEMDSFLIWKRRKGIRTDLYSLSYVGSDTASIRSFIQNQYDSLGVTFCLLVGDGHELPPAAGTAGMATGRDADPVYAYTDGDDYYPDLFIGRFSSDSISGSAVVDPINIRNQVMRSIKYERNPQEGEDWYCRGLMVASNESDYGDTITDKMRCEWLKDTLLYNIPPYFTYTSIDSSYNPWGTSSLISIAINEGVSMINYIGHGSPYAWWSGGSFNTGRINSLINHWKLPHVISVGCEVGNFNGYDCFSEAALTAGTPDYPTGFIVTYASTIGQTWIPPCIGQQGAINLLAHYKANTAGGVYFNGSNYMIEQYGRYGGDTIVYGAEIAQTWHIFGDPSLQLRTDTPEEIEINKVVNNFTDSLVCEINVYEENPVTLVEDALVAVYNVEDSLIGSGYTNALGSYGLIIDTADFKGNEYVYITVTGFNYVTLLDSINIGDPGVTPVSYYFDISAGIIDNVLEVNYDIPQPVDVEFIVYDVLGRRVVSQSRSRNAGIFRDFIDMQDFSSGVYFVMLKAGNSILTPKKFVVIR